MCQTFIWQLLKKVLRDMYKILDIAKKVRDPSSKAVGCLFSSLNINKLIFRKI